MLQRHGGLSGKVSLKGTAKKEKASNVCILVETGEEMNLMEKKYASPLHIIENPAFIYDLCDNEVFSILKCSVAPPESVVSRPR